MTRFNDNQRLHIFVVDLATKQVRQLTQGDTDSIPSTGRPMAKNPVRFESRAESG